MHGPSSTVACALWLTCVALLLQAAEGAAPGARRHDRRVRPGSAVAAVRSADNAAGTATDADDYDRGEEYDEEYEDRGDSQKRPPPPPPPPPPPKTTASLTPGHRTIILSYYNNILFISYGTTKNVTGVPLKDIKPQIFPFDIVLILPYE